MLKLAGFNSTIYSFNKKTGVSFTPSPPGAFALDRKQMKMWRRYNKPGSTFTDIQNHLPLMFHKMPLDVFSLLDFFMWATSWSAIDLGENWFLSVPWLRITLSP